MRGFRSIRNVIAAASLAVLGAQAAVAATVIDLTTASATGTLGDATYTQTMSNAAAGSGVFQPFVRLAPGGSAPTARGYNTSENNVFDTQSVNNYDHDITVGEVGFFGIDANGQNGFMRFVLDINQNKGGTNELLSLNEVQVFISTTPNQSVETFTGAGLVDLDNSFLVYRLDDGDNNRVELNYALRPGSGRYDMTLDIAQGAFEDAFILAGLSGATDPAANAYYIYLYSQFGPEPNPNNDGFEEWAARKGGAPVGCIPSAENGNCGQQQIPEPGTLSIVALGLLGAAVASRRRRQS